MSTLVNKMNKTEEDLVELACEESTAHVKEWMEGNDDMRRMIPHEETKAFVGDLISFYGHKQCYICGEGSIQVSVNADSTVIRCQRCNKTWEGKTVPFKNYPNLAKFFNVVFNITVNNNYNTIYTNQDEQKLGWNDFAEDGLEIVEDSEINSLLLQSLSGTHLRLGLLMHAVFGSKTICASEVDTNKKKWYVYESPVWVRKSNRDINRMLSGRNFLSLIVKAQKAYEGSNVKDKEKKLKQIENVKKNLETQTFQNNVIEQFATECSMDCATFMDLTNKKRHLLPFTNGVYDLETGVFREGDPEDYMTISIPYEYNEEKMYKNEEVIAEFNDFYFKVFPDKDLAKWVLKYLGSCLAGYTNDQIFVFGRGEGSNGKGVLINLMKVVLGSYAGKMDAGFLCGSMPDPDKPTPTLTRLENTRFVYLSETIEGAKINEQLFKCLCGEEPMVMRPMYREQREFVPEFKFLMVCNSMPSFDGSDYAMKRRLRVIPFKSTFVDEQENPDPEKHRYLKDKSLMKRLETWKYAVMGILLRAYELYLDEGLGDVPEVMRKYTESYVTENDVMRQYVDEILEIGDGKQLEYKTLTNEVYASFKKYCEEKGMKQMAATLTEKTICKRLTKTLAGQVQYKESKCTEKWGRKTQRFFEGIRMRVLE